MPVKVCKFGGTSMADAAQLQKIKRIIESDETRRFVVPSAPGKRFPGDEKITDLLYLCASQAAAGDGFSSIFAIIRQRYLDIEKELALSTNMTLELNAIEKNIAAGATRDYIASRGEYLAALLLADYLGFEFLDATELVCFHSDGTYDDETTFKWSQKLEDMRQGVVVPGFYGRKWDGGVRTFSRGGSDISGAIVARGAHAEVYENWTDVDGFLMADPRIVELPRIMRTVSYAELRELSYMGASVLHEDSIFPVRRAKIPINVRNTNKPDEPGTMIVPDSSLTTMTRDSVITGVAGKAGFTVITVFKDNMHDEVGFGARMLRVLERHNVSFEHIPSGIDTMSVILSELKVEQLLPTLLAEIHEDCSPNSIEVHPNMALIATVGKGMVRHRGVAARLFSALFEAGVNVRMIDQGSSEMNIIVGVENADLPAAVRAIYHAFV